MHKSEIAFCFVEKKDKRNTFLNSVFLFATERKKGNMPQEVDFSLPGRSKDDEIS